MEIPFDKVVLINPSNPSEAVSAMASNVEQKFGELGITVEHATLGKAATSKKFVISLLEAENPLISDISETDFKNLKKALLQSAGGVWISRGGRQVDPQGNPSFCAITGLLRVLRCEKPDTRYHELNFSSKTDISSGAAADIVARILKSLCNDELLNLESEWSELNGHIYIPRLFDEPHKNHSLQTIGSQPLPELELFCQANRPLQLDIGVPGMLDTLRFIDDPRPLDSLAEDEVEIEVSANAINFL